MEHLTKSELKRLFRVAYEHNRVHHLCLVVGLWHGLRVSELVGRKGYTRKNGAAIPGTPGLCGRDIVDGQLSVQRLKKSKSTCQPIHKDADPLFDESPLLEMGTDNPGRLFPFSRQRVDQFIRKYGQIAGIHPDKWHAHCLKHSLAMLLWDATHNLGQIQSYLGHKAASSTLCYLAEADSQKAQAAVAGIAI
jgi:integrase